MLKFRQVFGQTTVTDKRQVGDRVADVVATFEEPLIPFGKRLIVEVQHKHETRNRRPPAGKHARLVVIKGPPYRGDEVIWLRTYSSTMGSGIRTEVRIDAPTGCPVARVSAETETPCYSMSKSVNPESGGNVTEEFVFDSGVPVEDVELEVDELTRVFSYGSKAVYRFSRATGRGCPCECIEQFDCPVVDVYTRNGALFLVFHAPDLETLQNIIASLRDQYSNLDVQRLLRTRQDETEQDLVFVDRTTLTDRQQEVLETAHTMGYFDHPKRANAGEVADALDVTTTTFTEHLAAAQTKLLDSVLNQ